MKFVLLSEKGSAGLGGLFSIVLLFVSTTVCAQFAMYNTPPASVLHPEPSRWWIGPQIGMNLNSHSGNYYTQVCECKFSDGDGTGLTAGLEFGHKLSSTIGIALKLVYSDLQAQYSSPVRLPSQTPEFEIIEVDFVRKLDVLLGYFMINPVLQVYPLDFFYVFAGPAVGFNTTAHQDYVLEIKDPDIEFAYSGLTTQHILEDSGDIPKAELLRADLRLGVGLNLPFSRNVRIAPELSYNIPFTTIADVNGWKASALHLTAVLKFDL